MSQDEEQQDDDIQTDSDSSGSEAVLTSSGSEVDTNSDSMDFGVPVPELRSIRNVVSEEEVKGVNTTLHQVLPWVEDINDSIRHRSRIQLFQYLATLCAWLDPKYNMEAPKSYANTRDLFKANPRLVSEIDGCWRNPEGSFLPICNIGEYF